MFLIRASVRVRLKWKTGLYKRVGHEILSSFSGWATSFLGANLFPPPASLSSYFMTDPYVYIKGAIYTGQNKSRLT
jgi:hypothetical protein